MTFGLVHLAVGDREIRLDSIQSISAPHKKVEGYGDRKWSFDARTAYLDGPLRAGERPTATLTESEFECLLRRPVQLLPAEPATSMVRAWVDATGVEMQRTPVIAWALCVDGLVRPVTTDGVNDGCGDEGWDKYGLFVELPGGRIEGVGEHTEPPYYDNAQEMSVEAAKRYASKSAGDNA